MCETLEKEHPNRDIDFYLMFLATETLRLMIDNDWVNQALFKQNENTSRVNRNAFEFFRSETGGFRWQERVLRFAERVYNLQTVANFDSILKDIISGELVSRYAEIEVGSHLKSRAIPFEYNLPRGRKTEDFDMRILCPNQINCEVKHKIESTAFSENTLKNTVSGANKQLPKDNHSIIFVKIPFEWVTIPNVENEILRVFNPFFLRNRTNNLAIVIRWEEQNQDNPNMFFWKYKVYKNPHLGINEQLDNFFSRLSSDRLKDNWVSYNDILQKYIKRL